MVIPISCPDSVYIRDNIQGKPLGVRIYLYVCWLTAIILHLGQDRRIGGRVVEHPMVVSTLVKSFGLGVRSQAAALLHDAIEDKKGWQKILAGLLVLISGPIVFLYAIGLTNFFGKNNRRYFRWILLFAKFFWVILVIKLADRLHNETCPYGGNPENAKRKHTETLKTFTAMCRFGRRYIPAEHRLHYDEWLRQARTLARHNLAALTAPS